MEKNNKPDLILLGVSAILVLSGILILTSVSASFSLQKFGTTLYFLNHQLLFGLVPGLVLGSVAFFMPLNFFKRFSFFLLFLNILFLGMVFLPGIGGNIGGVYRWIFFGPFSFQPSEFLKVTLIVYGAAWLATRTKSLLRSNTKSPRGFWIHGSWSQTFIPFSLMIGVISVFLILQPDISTLGIIGITALIMYFTAPTPVWHTILMAGGGIIALGAIIRLAPYRLSRLASFFDPSFDPLGQGYQIKQALIGIGSGGLTGVGLGLSFQKFGVLPEPISDSIFAVFSEEMGFLGGSFLILLFLLFAWRSFLIAKKIREDTFAQLAVVGIASWICLQAFINMGSMIGIVPIAGIPLPFISYGGSALAAELIALGIILNISRRLNSGQVR